MHFPTLLVVAGAAAVLASPSPQSFELPVYRASANASQDSGTGTTGLDNSLYWYGHFTVGDSQDLKLLIDTGSTDCILNEGVYKPSKYKKKFNGGQDFTISYEGVNKAGFGFETIKGTTALDQVIGAGGLRVPNQAIGNVTSFSFADTKAMPTAYENDGIIGFAQQQLSSFNPPHNAWFFNLCSEKIIANCQFGLAFGTKGTGVSVIGKLAKRLIKGPLVTVPQIDGYSVTGDVALDNKIILENQTFIMDVGTNNIQGPIKQTSKIFKLLGYPTVAHRGSASPGGKKDVEVLQAYFPCNKPPTLGFSFPSRSTIKAGEQTTIFNVSPDVWDVHDHGNNNCTSILGGTNALNSPTGPPTWLLGQAFFSGHYVDFNNAAKTIGYGQLKNPATVT